MIMKIALTPNELLRLKEQYLIPGVYHFYKRPPHLVRGEGVYLYDSEDRKYLDFYAGVSVNVLGHGDPELAEAVSDQVKTLAHTTTIYLTQPMLQLAETLAAITPGKLRKTFFCADGSGANETAILLAQNAKQRRGMVALNNALHGNTKMTMSVTGLDFWRTDPWPEKDVVFAPAPHCYRCPLNKTFGTCDIACATELDTRISACKEKPAAMILEMVQGNGGIVVPPPEYVERMKEIVARHDLLLIVDEVQTGFGRTGAWFASQHFGLEPDIMTVAKALGGGIPVAATIATDAVASLFKGPRASTYGGNLVSMQAGQTVIKAIQQRGLVANASELGALLKEKLLTLKAKHALIGDVRGLGLMVGVELVLPDRSPATGATDSVLESLKDRGILAGKTGPGRNVLTFQPPLIITKEHVDEMCSTLDDVLSRQIEA